MARVGGRSIAMSWIAGVVCTGVVLGLVWLSFPIVPVLAGFVGDTMRSALP